MTSISLSLPATGCSALIDHAVVEIWLSGSFSAYHAVDVKARFALQSLAGRRSCSLIHGHPWSFSAAAFDFALQSLAREDIVSYRIR
jgi:hypothetical protein